MAAIVVNQGLQTIGARASDTGEAGLDTSTGIESMSVDDSTSSFAAGDTSLGGPTNVHVNDFDSTPSRSNQTFSHVATFGTGEANFTVRRIALHNEAAANVSGTSNTLVGGIDGQAITKTSDFSMQITVDIQYTDNSGTNSLVVNQGLQIIGAVASDTGESGIDRPIDSLAVDDSSTSFSSGDTDLGGPTNVAVSNFDSTPSRSSQTFTHTATFGTSEANFTITRVSLHNNTAANVSGTSNTLVAGIDSQSITKTNDFSLTISVDLTYTDNS